MVKYTKVAIRSKTWGTYLSLDGTGITCYRSEPYRGTVKTTNHVKAWEIFNLHHNENGTVSFESSAFPGVYLTLNGNGLTAGVINYNGGGYIAAQYGNLGWEKYYIRRLNDSTATIYIESAAFPGRFVRAEQALYSQPNVQAVPQPFEQFEIVVVSDSFIPSSY